MFNLITGVYPIDAGRILLDGVDIARMPSRRRIRHGVARNFQNIRLMPHLSALENVLVGQHCRNRGLFGVLQPVNLLPGNRWREEARAALAEAGLAAYERATVGSLPYGVQKRIELVRALMAQPRLLLLDEPAAGLNPAETDALRERIAAICRDRGITLLVVEHDMHFVGALCDAGGRAQLRPQDRRGHARRRSASDPLVQRGLSRHRRAEQWSQRHAS